jgi:hypothetical protein
VQAFAEDPANHGKSNGVEECAHGTSLGLPPCRVAATSMQPSPRKAARTPQARLLAVGHEVCRSLFLSGADHDWDGEVSMPEAELLG